MNLQLLSQVLLVDPLRAFGCDLREQQNETATRVYLWWLQEEEVGKGADDGREICLGIKRESCMVRAVVGGTSEFNILGQKSHLNPTQRGLVRLIMYFSLTEPYAISCVMMNEYHCPLADHQRTLALLQV